MKHFGRPKRLSKLVQQNLKRNISISTQKKVEIFRGDGWYSPTNFWHHISGWAPPAEFSRTDLITSVLLVNISEWSAGAPWSARIASLLTQFRLVHTQNSTYFVEKSSCIVLSNNFTGFCRIGILYCPNFDSYCPKIDLNFSKNSSRFRFNI